MRDLILYVCTPLLLVPIFIAAQGSGLPKDIYLFVAAVRRKWGTTCGDDSRLRRPRLISAFPMADHLRARFSSWWLRGFSLWT